LKGKAEKKMELEHVLHHPGWFLAMQLLMGSMMVPAMINRNDLYRSFVRSVASHVVTFGPFGLLVYVLFEVAKLS
jgi:hypothetical protein